MTNSVQNIKSILNRYGVKSPDESIEFTLHARQRYIERFRSPAKYQHLSFCTHKDCLQCMHLSSALLHESKAQRQTIEEEMNERLERATEEKSYINNSQLMSYLYDKYGYEFRFQLFRDDNVIFVIRISDSKKYVITVLTTEFTIGRCLTNHTKYRKKPQKQYA